MEQPEPAPANSPSPQSRKSSGYIAILSVLAAIVVIIVLVVVYKSFKHSKAAMVPSAYQTSTQATAQASTPPKVTAQNANQVLDQTGAAIESDINQMDQDLKALDQNDPSQDNANNI